MLCPFVITFTQSKLLPTKQLIFSMIHFIIERKWFLFFFFCISPDENFIIVCPFKFVRFTGTLFFFNDMRITQQYSIGFFVALVLPLLGRRVFL